MAKVRINYRKVISQAETIEDLGDKLRKQIDELEDFTQDGKNIGQGKASEAFFKEVATLKRDMQTTYRETTNVASTIKSVARRIKREDEAAAERASKL